jgi:predicted GH43/DUF377 family glycosyl hydrolase
MAIIIIFMVSMVITSFGQTQWTKYPGNPVMDVGPTGSWDDEDIKQTYVIWDSTVYHMWYQGWSGSANSHRVGYATSPDGIQWEKDTLNNPVLEPGPPGSWEDEHIIAYSVIFEGEVYKMWYSGFSDNLNEWSIGYATSADGISWGKDTLNNPIMEKGSLGSWDDHYVATPQVLYNGEIYEMWYTGDKSGSVEEHIGYATSADGISWEKDTLNNPILGPGPEWVDNWEIWCSRVILLEGVYKMWYVGISDGGVERTCYATSDPTAIDDNITAEHPRRFFLSKNYPNPFNPTTIINYELPITNDVELSIYNLIGQKVTTLVSGKKNAGYHQVEWDASGFASGVYYYRIEAGEFRDVKKMILIR